MAEVKKGLRVRIPRVGAQWLYGRFMWCVLMAVVNILRGVAKVMWIEEGMWDNDTGHGGPHPYYTRHWSEIFMNFYKGLVARPLLAWSFYVHWDNP